MTTESIGATSVEPLEAGDPTFMSALKEGRQRFLAHAIEHSFVCGRRTAQDFIRHFPPPAIMKGLEHQPNLRANILVLTTGLKQKIALKKSWEDATTDLQIALDEGETDAESVVSLFGADDRVRYLDDKKIWAFLTEAEFWKSSKTQSDVARNHVAFMLERALEDQLITHRDVVEGVTVDELAVRLPKAELGRLIQCALNNSNKSTPFTEADLLATTPPRILVQYVPLSHIWETVIVPRVAERHGYCVSPDASQPASEDSPPAVVGGRRSEQPSAVQDISALKSRAPLKDTPRNKETSAVKLKAPSADSRGRRDSSPGVRKASGDGGGDEFSEIDIVDDDLEAV